MKVLSGCYYEVGYKNHNGVSVEHYSTEEEAIKGCIKSWAIQRNAGYSNHDQVIFHNAWCRVINDEILMSDSHHINFVMEMKVEDYEQEIQNELKIG